MLELPRDISDLILLARQLDGLTIWWRDYSGLGLIGGLAIDVGVGIVKLVLSSSWIGLLCVMF